jgi:hypothetical protein
MNNLFEIKYEIKIKTNENNEMNLSICIKDTKLCVTCYFYKNYFKKTFSNSFTLDELKEISPYFRQFNSEQEVLNEIMNNTYKGKETIEGNEETSNLIILVIPVPGTQYKIIPFKLNEIIKTPEEILNEYKSVVNQYENKLKFSNLNSKILIGKDLEKETLKMWISPRKKLTAKLLFSFNDIDYKYNNGYETENSNLKETVETFHNKCDNITNILIICKSGTEIFGGYTPSCFSCKEDYGYDNDSFLFSLSRLEKYPKNSHNNSKSIWCYKKYGPSFEYDLHFKEEKINIVKTSKNYYNIYDKWIDETYCIHNGSEIILESMEIFTIIEDNNIWNTGKSKKNSLANLFGNPNDKQNNSKTKKDSQVKEDDKNNNKPLVKDKDEKIESKGKDSKIDEKTKENEIK